jgi:hypothetical protein
MEGFVSTISLQTQNSHLYIVFGRVPPTVTVKGERAFIEAAGVWLSAIQAKGSEFTLAQPSVDFATGVAEAAAKTAGGPLVNALGLGSAGTLVGALALGGLKLVLAMHQFRGQLVGIVVDIVQSMGDERMWQAADLTVRKGISTISQVWVWRLDSGRVIRGGGGFWDDAGNVRMPELSPETLENTLRQITPRY